MGFLIETTNGIVQTTSGFADYIASERVEVKTNSVYGQINAFRKSSVVQSAITRRVNAFANLKVWAQDSAGKRVLNPTVTADLKKMEMFNPYQSFQVFSSQVEAYCAIFGTCYVYKAPIVGFSEYDCYVIPNNIIQPFYKLGTDAMFQRKVEYYNISVGTEILKLYPEEVEVIYDNCFSFNGYGLGESRLIALAEPISTLLSIGEVSTQLIADGGARGIIGQGAKDIDMISAPFLENEKKAIQAELKNYGGLRSQFKYIVTKGAASYIPLTGRIVDMDLTGRALDATIQIFDRYGIPSIFASKEPRFKAMPEARKEMYTATVIPEATPRYAALVKLKGIPERVWKYSPDWSHMDFFQESLKEGAIALSQVSAAIKPLIESGVISIAQAQSILEPYI